MSGIRWVGRITAAILLGGCLQAGAQEVGDYHQHLLSPVVAELVKAPKPFVATDLIPLLDTAGIHRAVILSLAYQFGNPNRAPVPDEYGAVRAENDWTSAQVALFPDRLIGFCGVNPLKDYAVTEINRCSRDANLRAGLKLHFGNSDVDLDNAEHIAKLQQVFRAADRHGMAITVHLHANVDHHRPYGAQEARVFLTQVMPFAPHVVIQVAHLAGSGGYDDPSDDEALGAFVAAIRAHDPVVKNLWFDVASVAGIGDWEDKKQLIASRIEQVGVKRVLYGTDGSWAGFTPAKGLSAFKQLPLSKKDIHTVLTNVPPYTR
jgi:uncharacterized protein